jgi:dihydrofolate synthase/folylpolyglutamate synthase
LQEAGFRVGLYTSPHLKSFTERIQINGNEIEEQWIIEFVERNKLLLAEFKPSFFEWTVIMAFCYFKEQKVDWAIIETGLGGRLDSTNVIKPESCLITNISWDHQDILGDTLEKIAIEKAGIIKQNIPTTISEREEASEKIFLRQSQTVGTELIFAEDMINIVHIENNPHSLKISYQKGDEIFQLESPYKGRYQIKNIRGVLAWCEQLVKNQLIHLSNEQINLGIKNTRKNTRLKGRWEILHTKPMIIADTAHNVGGINELFHQLTFEKFNELYIILGMVADKDIDKVLSILPKQAKYIFTQAENPRSLFSEELKNLANRFHLIGEVIENVNLAISKTKERAGEDDFILITGSTYLVAEIDMI